MTYQAAAAAAKPLARTVPATLAGKGHDSNPGLLR